MSSFVKLLVVDPDRESLQTSTELLKSKEGLQIVQAESGEACLDLVIAERPDIVLLEEELPDISGAELCRTLKTDPDLAGSFVVLCLGEGSGKEVPGSMADAYINYPLTAEQLLSRIGDFVRTRQAGSGFGETGGQYTGDFPQVPIGLYRSGPNGEKYGANPFFASLLGYPDMESYLETPVVDEYASPEDYENWKKLLEEKDVLTNHLVQQRRTDGSVIWVRENARVVRDGERRALYYEGSVEDVTEHRNRGLSIQKQNSFLMNILDSFSYPFYVVDIADLKVQMANKAAGEVIPGTRSCHSLTHRSETPCGDESHPCPIKEVVMTGKPVVAEHLHFNDDGTPRYDEVHAHPIFDDAGKVSQVIKYSMDVTERKLAERALEDSEKTLRAIAENYPNSFLSLVDRDLKVVYSAGQEFRNRDLDPDSFQGLSVEEVFGAYGEETLATVRENYLESFQGGGREFELFLDDQHQLYKTVPLPDDAGVIRQILVVVENITKRKTVEMELEDSRRELAGLVEKRTTELTRTNRDLLAKIQTLRELQRAMQESREQYRLLADNATDLISLHDEQGIYLYASPASGPLLGYEPQELVGRDSYKLFHPDDVLKVQEHHRSTLWKGQPMPLEYRILKKNGGYTWFETISRVISTEGEADRIIAVSRDISRRKDVESAMLESEQRLQALFEESSDAIFIYDLKGKLLDANKQACEMTGYAREELLGLSINRLYTEDSGSAADSAMALVNREGSVRFESSFRKESGDIINVDISANKVEIGQGIVQAIIRDITEQKASELEMKRRLMKFKLEEGLVYIHSGDSPGLAREALKDLLKVGYRAVAFSRTPPELFRTSVGEDVDSFWLAEIEGRKVQGPDLGRLGDKLRLVSRKMVVYVENLEYLALKNGFAALLFFVQRLRELAYMKGLIVIIALDPSILSSEERKLLEKEATGIESFQKAPLPHQLLEIVEHIYKQNLVGVKPTYGDIQKAMGVSKPTIGKRLSRLLMDGYLKVEEKGNRKTLELTYHGMNLLLE